MRLRQPNGRKRIRRENMCSYGHGMDEIEECEGKR